MNPVVLLSFIPPLLYCKRGLDSSKEWRKWERKEHSRECSPNLNINSSIPIPPCIMFSHQAGCFSTLSWAFHQDHHPMLHSLLAHNPKPIMQITLAATARHNSSWTRAPQIIDPLLSLLSINPMTLILTLMLILLSICKRPYIYIYRERERARAISRNVILDESSP